MATTLSVRAGSSLRARLRYWQPDRSGYVDTTGSHAVLQLRSVDDSSRLLMHVKEVALSAPDAVIPPGTVLARIRPGEWRLLLGRSATRSLPSLTRFEVEVVNDFDPDDAVHLTSGVIRVTPEVSAYE